MNSKPWPLPLTSAETKPALELLARIHQAHPDAGNIRRAARFARASRLLEDQQACPEHGYLLIPSGIRAVRSGEIQAQSLWESSRLHFPPGLGFRGVPISRA
jgi:hypothetical protein